MTHPSITRDEARALFAAHLDYSVLTPESIRRLRSLINQKMVESAIFNDTLRCRQRGIVHKGYAEIRCKAFYFDSREAVTFNPDGFIGFAGWASDHNAQPILDGFQAWVNEMAGATKMAA
jgi:hypothetical protein